MKTFTFRTSEMIYKYLMSGSDLYCVDDEVYMFEYSNVGSIAYYDLSLDELLELADEVGPDDYIGSALGPGGYIIDPDGREEYNDDVSKLDYSPIYEFLDQFVGKKFISADAADLLDNKVTESWYDVKSKTVKDWFSSVTYKEPCDFVCLVDPVDNTLWEGEPWVFDEMHIYGDCKIVDEFYDGNGLCILTIKD